MKRRPLNERKAKPSTRKTPKVPKLCRHERSGQAYVRINGKFHYLGVLDAPETDQRYHQFCAEWIANGGQLPVSPEFITVTEVALAYFRHAEEYYRRDGKPTTQVTAVRLTLRALRSMYGNLPATQFTPAKLRAFMEHLTDEGKCISTINARVGIVRRAFKWAAAHDLVEPTVWHGLLTVDLLKPGRSRATDPKKVLAVSRESVDAILPHCSPVLEGIIQLMWLTGMRPGEACEMRPVDIDTSVQPRIYRPAHHKTQHHGHIRQILLGPKAQTLLMPFLDRNPNAACFSPAESAAWYAWQRSLKRKTPKSCGNRVGTNRVNNPQRRPSEQWTTISLSRAIHRACQKAGIEGWSANQLRHAAATRIRAEHGLEAAALALGHSSAKITDSVYAERDFSKLRKIVSEAG